MDMLNPYCGVDRDPRGVVRLTICNAGSLNMLGTAVINAVREGLDDAVRGDLAPHEDVVAETERLIATFEARRPQ